MSQSHAQPAVQSNDPLHGRTLERILIDLVKAFGWAALGQRVAIRCFKHEPSIGSSLKFLRRTPWARAQVEALYVEMVRADQSGQRPRAPACRRSVPIVQEK